MIQMQFSISSGTLEKELVTVHGMDDWTFTYDDGGSRVKQANPDGTTTLFLGGRAI